MKYYLLIRSCIFLLFSCSPNKQQEALFAQADSLLNSNPDSALLLLQTLPDLQELSRKECARYALLLARAPDKAVKPLLPCDSLLSVALHYYDNNEKAIKNLQEGLEILNEFPKETETRRNVLSSLATLVDEKLLVSM